MPIAQSPLPHRTLADNTLADNTLAADRQPANPRFQSPPTLNAHAPWCTSVASAACRRSPRNNAAGRSAPVMPYGLDQLGRPSFLISTMAMHTQNILGDSRASLLVTHPDASGDPLGAARLTLMGETARVPEEELNQVRELYLGRYENAKYWVDFSDFAFYRMEVVDVYYVGGFGVMGWVAADEYARAEADPLADTASEIIQHMNADHADALVVLARGFAGVEAEEATMTSVDRLGFHLRLKTGDHVHSARVPFIREVRNTQETRPVLIEMVKEARQRV